MKTRTTSHARSPRVIPPDAAGPKLPHDHDESPEAEGAPRQIIEQAQRDLAEGRVDTDNYTRALEITKPALARRRSRN